VAAAGKAHIAICVLLAAAQASCSEVVSLFAPSRLAVSEGFTLAVIPDTQCYTGGAVDQPGACGAPHGSMSNDMFLAQVSHIATNRMASRIVAAIGVGDIVNCGQDTSQWEKARTAYDYVDAAGIPFAAVIGNHDYDSWCLSGFSSRAAENYNRYFGPSRFYGRPWYGRHYPAASNENFYIGFEADGEQYLVLGLEYLPRDAALAWADEVLTAHSDHKVIVALHSHLDGNGAHHVFASTGNSGASVWDKLLRRHGHIILVVSGHDPTSRRIDIGNTGNQVPQLQSNYQFEEAGGSGYMRLLHVRPAAQQIDVSTYSPFLRRRRTDASNQFTVHYGVRPQGFPGRGSVVIAP
jgi:hypothetical protein